MTHLNAIHSTQGNLYRLSWLSARIRRPLGPDAVGVEAVDDAGRVLGMVAFDQWCGRSVGVHVAVDNPLALRHAYIALEDVLRSREVVWCLVEEHGRSARLARRLGFVDSGRVPGATADGRDAVLLVLTRQRFADWRSHVRQPTTPA